MVIVIYMGGSYASSFDDGISAVTVQRAESRRMPTSIVSARSGKRVVGGNECTMA
jgi:hypothetical protein